MKRTWTTREGKVIPIKEMTDSHLTNTIRYLRRHAPFFQDRILLECISAASMLHGEMAIDLADRDIDYMTQQDPEEFLEENNETYSWLLKEANKRKLSVVDEI